MAIKNYYSPTPKKWRKLGDALLAISTSVTGYTIYANEPTIAVISLVLGVVGKFLTNFFSED
mgnify:CR=1 FL=1